MHAGNAAPAGQSLGRLIECVPALRLLVLIPVQTSWHRIEILQHICPLIFKSKYLLSPEGRIAYKPLTPQHDMGMHNVEQKQG